MFSSRLVKSNKYSFCKLDMRREDGKERIKLIIIILLLL